MPELRRDPVVGYWTIISTERSRRPVEFAPREIVEERACPFCEGKESATTAEVFAVRQPGTQANGPGWQVRAIASKMPILNSTNPLQIQRAFGRAKTGQGPAGFVAGKADRYAQGIYDCMEGIGEHELIIESPAHKHSLDEMTVPDIEKVIQVYVQRLNDLDRRPEFKYTLLFKNHGLISGSARDVIRHTRTQLITTPVTPKRVKEELTAAKNYFERHDRCVFCDILRQESQEGLRLVAQNPHFFAFCPFASRTPFETWILPKDHSADFGKMDPAHFHDFAAILKEALSKIRVLLDDPPYNFILHTAPYRHTKREGYWETIEEDYHWYFQIAPRLTHDAGFEWGTGVHINPTPPEDAAFLLRETKVEV